MSNLIQLLISSFYLQIYWSLCIEDRFMTCKYLFMIIYSISMLFVVYQFSISPIPVFRRYLFYRPFCVPFSVLYFVLHFLVCPFHFVSSINCFILLPNGLPSSSFTPSCCRHSLRISPIQLLIPLIVVLNSSQHLFVYWFIRLSDNLYSF